MKSHSTKLTIQHFGFFSVLQVTSSPVSSHRTRFRCHSVVLFVVVFQEQKTLLFSAARSLSLCILIFSKVKNVHLLLFLDFVCCLGGPNYNFIVLFLCLTLMRVYVWSMKNFNLELVLFYNLGCQPMSPNPCWIVTCHLLKLLLVVEL